MEMSQETKWGQDQMWFASEHSIIAHCLYLYRLLDPVFRSVPEFSRLRDYVHHKENEEENKGKTPVPHLPSEVSLQSISEGKMEEEVEEERMESEGVMSTTISLLEVDSKDQVGGIVQ